MLRVAAAAAVFALVLARPAYADDSAAADALFQDAKALMKAKRAAEACPKLEASYRLEKKLGTLLNWADCLEQVGKVATAFTRFGEAADWASKEHDSRADFASARRDGLKARLPKLLLDVKLGREKLGVAVGGTVVPESTYGVAVAIDPGPVTVAVERGEAELEKHDAVAREGEQLNVALDLDAIARAHPALRELPRRRTQETAGLVTGAVGVVGLVTFAGLEGAAFSKKTEANGPGLCREDSTNTAICTPRGAALLKSAGDLAEAGQWVGVGSAVVAAVGVTLLVTAPRRAPRAPTTSARTTIVPLVPVGGGPFGVALLGAL